ncbi:MAG: DUF4376 domain-containing protein [Hyphomicrobiaceae bacterium]|nr:MAG: DUF4376 domain-containing protein [Hyphomicrobiaceae bacterium]
MATKHVVGANGISQNATMAPEEQTALAASLAPSAEMLAAYATSRRRRMVDGGTIIDVGAGRLVPAWTDSQSIAAITGLVLATQLDPQFTTSWKGRDGVFYPLAAAEIVALGLGMLEFVQSAFALEEAVAAAVGAQTITTYAEVDAAMTA